MLLWKAKVVRMGNYPGCLARESWPRVSPRGALDYAVERGASGGFSRPCCILAI
jgi:hypothetical protein